MDSLERLQAIRRDQEIDGWRVRLYFWSRDIWLLAGIAVTLLAIAAAIGWLSQSPEPARDSGAKDHPPHISLGEELNHSDPDPNRVFEGLSAEFFSFANPERARSYEGLIRTSKLSEEIKQVALAYLQSSSMEDGLPGADLLFYAHWVKPFPFANELVAELHLRSDDFAKAQKYFEREVRFHDSHSSRKRLVEMLTVQHNFKALSPLAKDPRYSEHISLHTNIFLTAHEHRWRDLLKPLATYQATMWRPMPVMLALVSGVVWMMIALQAIQPQALFSFRVAVPFLAVFSGMVSTWPTLFAGLWEEEIWGLRHTGEFLADFVFFVVGVGPREELIKLAFFLPFVPFLLLRGNRLEMLMVAGCVGLGFAIEENLQYFEQAGPMAAFSRFLTANFFHLAATGIIGLAFCDALLSPKKKILPFVVTLLGVTLAHGFYDAFLSLWGLPVIWVFSMITFLLLALFFFRQLRTLRDGTTDQLSIAATLVIGLALIVGLTFVLASRELGFELAGVALAANGLSLIMVCYMFYWQLGEGMSAVETAPR